MKLSITVTALAFLLYAITLAPGLTWAHDGDDGGDLAAAVGVGGVPHPPGYPTYLLAGAAAAQVPAGDLAWRLNLLSAVCAALAAGAVAAAVVRVTGGRAAGALAGLTWACAPVVWGQAVIAEVYALNAFFVALLVYIAVVGREPRGGRAQALHGVLSGVVLGLGLGTGTTLVLCAPLVAWSCGRDARRWAGALAGMCAGALVFAILPVRAQAQPPVNWGDASRLDGFAWLVTARAYAGLPFGVPAAEWPQRIGALLGMLAWQFTPAGPVLAAWGLVRTWRLDRALALASAASAGAYVLFATFYAAADSYVYLIPALVIAALWLGAGAAAVDGRPPRQHGGRQASGIRQRATGSGELASGDGQLAAGASRWGMALFVLPVVSAIVGYGAADASRDRAATDWTARALDSAPPRAVLVSRNDGYTFSLWYAHYVQHARPDIVVCDWDLWAFDWYRAGLARETGVALPQGMEIEDAFGGRPVCRLDESGAKACRTGGAFGVERYALQRASRQHQRATRNP